jgi:hypothetical protein
MAFNQFLGGGVLLAIASNVFRTELINNLLAYGYPGDVSMVIEVGAQGVRQLVKPQDLPLVIQAYNDSLATTFVSNVKIGGGGDMADDFAVCFLSLCCDRLPSHLGLAMD